MTNHLKSIKLNNDRYPTDSNYPFNLPLFKETDEIFFNSTVTFFAGENGTGKSTLLEAMALAAGIHIWRRSEGTKFEYNPYEKLMFRYISLNWVNDKIPGSYFSSESYNDFRKITDNWASSDPGQLKYFGGKSLVTQSHGQSIMSYFRSRYGIEGIYFLDEPETALSPKSQLELLDILRENSDKGHAQFFIATHSPILLSFENGEIYNFDQSPISEIKYKDTENYKIYREFLMDI